MKIATILTVLLALIPTLLASPAWAKKQKAVAAACQTKFSVVREDHLKNISQGLSKKDIKWFQKKIEKKYPDVCYVPPAPDVPLVFFITDTPAVYHGTRVERDTETHDSPVTGTIDNEDGSTSDVDGTVRTTTTSRYAVPYTADYGIYTLTVETSNGGDNWTARHRFQQKGLYERFYGIPVGKGHHPARAVIEEAAKWVHEGGLNNPLETIVPE